MGLFDDLKFEKVPDGIDPELRSFQTKDLGCDMAEYTVSAAGRLFLSRSGWCGLPERVGEDTNYHGYMDIIGWKRVENDEQIFPRYRLKFTDGQLVGVECTDDGRLANPVSGHE